jgi:hypothetical protein
LTQKQEKHSLSARVGLHLYPHPLMIETLVQEAGRQTLSFAARDYRSMFLGAGFSEREIDTVADSFVEKLMIFGSEHKIKDHLQELLTTEIDELAISLVGVSDPAQEPVRLARLMSQL